MLGRSKNLVALMLVGFFLYGCGNDTDKKIENKTATPVINLENKIYSEYYDDKLKEPKPDPNWKECGMIEKNGALTLIGRIGVECEAATNASILLNKNATKKPLPYGSFETVLASCKKGAIDGLEKRQPDGSLYLEPRLRKQTETNETSSTKN